MHRGLCYFAIIVVHTASSLFLSEYKVPDLESEYKVPDLESEYKVPDLESEYKLPDLESEYKVPDLESEYKVDSELKCIIRPLLKPVTTEEIAGFQKRYQTEILSYKCVYVPDLESEYNLDSDDSRFNVTTSFSYQTFHNYLMKDFLSLILLITSFILLPVHIFVWTGFNPETVVLDIVKTGSSLFWFAQYPPNQGFNVLNETKMVQLLLVDNHELCYRLFNCGKNLFKHGIEICHKLIGLCIPPFHKEAKIYFSDAKFKIPKCKGTFSHLHLCYGQKVALFLWKKHSRTHYDYFNECRLIHSRNGDWYSNVKLIELLHPFCVNGITKESFRGLGASPGDPAALHVEGDSICNQIIWYLKGIIYNRQFIYFQFPVIHEKLNGHEVVELLKKRIIINCDTFKQTTALSYSHESSIDKIEPFIYLMFPSSSNVTASVNDIKSGPFEECFLALKSKECYLAVAVFLIGLYTGHLDLLNILLSFICALVDFTRMLMNSWGSIVINFINHLTNITQFLIVYYFSKALEKKDERRLRLLLVVRATFMEFKRCIFILLKSLCTSNNMNTLGQLTTKLTNQGIANQSLKKPPNLNELVKICSKTHIASNWTMLAIQLGFSSAMVRKIATQHHNIPKLCFDHMKRKWLTEEGQLGMESYSKVLAASKAFGIDETDQFKDIDSIFKYLSNEPILWRPLGNSLGIPADKREILEEEIRENVSSQKICIQNMFEAWLKWETGTGYEERSWCTVIVALVNCGHSDASKAIISQIMDSHSHPLKLILGKLLIHKVGTHFEEKNCSVKKFDNVDSGRMDPKSTTPSCSHSPSVGTAKTYTTRGFQNSERFKGSVKFNGNEECENYNRAVISREPKATECLQMPSEATNGFKVRVDTTPKNGSNDRPLPGNEAISQDAAAQHEKKPPSIASSQVPHNQTPKSSLLFGERLAPVGKEDASDAPAPLQLVATPLQSTSLDPSARLLSTFKSKPSHLNNGQSPQSVATESSGEMVFAHKSGDMYGDQPHCISHMTNIPPPNTVHPTEFINTTESILKQNELDIISRNKEALGFNFLLRSFISALHLEYYLSHSQSPITIVDYVIDRAILEKMYLNMMLHTSKKKQTELFIPALKVAGVTPMIASDIGSEWTRNPRKTWNYVKTLADSLDIKIFASHMKAVLPKEDFHGIIKEIKILLRDKGSRRLPKSQVIHALFEANTDVAFIDRVLKQDNVLDGIPSLIKLKKVPLSKRWSNFWAEISKSFRFSPLYNPAQYLPSDSGMEEDILHCLGFWLAYKSESGTPITWSKFASLMEAAGYSGSTLALLPSGEIYNGERAGSFVESDFDVPVTLPAVEHVDYHYSKAEKTFGESDLTKKLRKSIVKREEKEEGVVDSSFLAQLQNVHQDKPINSPTHSAKKPLPSSPRPPKNVDKSGDHNQRKLPPSNNHNATRQAHRDAPVGESNQSQPGFFVPICKITDEDYLIKQPLDPKNPISVVIHAKAIYLTGDYPRCREVLSILDRQLLLDEEIQRARMFGVAISFYRQKLYKEAYQHLNRLEDVAMQHNASGDVAVASIYRGEIRLALKEYPKAIEMYEQARTTYDVKNVAHKFGVIIISKSAVILKLANCYKLTSNFRKAKEIFKMAVEHSVQLRKEAEALPSSDPKRKDKITQATKDEISTRHALGNLYQGMSDCNNSLEEYKEALRLQEALNDPLALGWAKGNLGNALLGLNRVHEAIPYLKEAFEFAKKYERSLLGIGRAASNLGNALQTVKRYKEANDYFEIAYGHAVFCNDEPAQARALGNLGNIKTLLEENLDALNCYNETLSLNCDEQAKINALQNRAQLYMTLAHKVNENVGEWDEVPSDVVAAEPSESKKLYLPVKESESSQTRHSRLVVSEGKYRTRDGLDNMKDIEDKHSNSDHEVISAIVPTSTQQSSDSPQEPTFASDQHYLSYRKYYLLKAKDDLEEVMTLIESSFDKVKGGTGSEEDTDSMALSLFESNSRAFYNLQRILVLLGENQESLKVAEANRARNLGEILWQKRKISGTVSLMQVNRPLELSSIWEFAQQEKSPVVMLSFTTSCMLVHIIFPGHATESSKNPSLATNVTSSSSSPSSYTASHTDPKTLIPPQNYHFLKIPLPTDLFSDPTSTEKVKFDQYVSKSLIDYLNQKEFDLFEPITLEEMNTPLNVLFDNLAFKFIEVIESKMPSIRDLVIIPDQTAQLLPWAILQDKSTGVFLGDRYTIRVFPSIFTMGIINSQPPVTITLPSEDRFLVVGNPTIPKVTHNNREISLGRLPHAEAEAVQIAHILEAPPVLKEQATKQTIVYRLQLANIVHIATHGSGTQGYLAFGASIPTLSLKQAVDAKEALLFIEEIQKLQLNASLVVLSACDSGRGQVANEGVNSVARAFLAAGAQSVLVSLLRVPDKSASIFMSFFYRLLAHDGYPTSKAIQKSSMAIRCIQQFSQHVHWGGLQLIGRDISIEYNKTCDSAKVSARVGDPSPFPRLDIMEEMEFALFRQDRLPPRDVVLVKGMSPHDPSEVVGDFVCRNFKHFPGGVFWLNCATDDLLKASLQEIEATIPSLTKLQKDPPEIKETMKKSPKYLESNIGKSFENHFRLYILDHPSNMETVIPLLPDLKHPQTDIIVIGPDDVDTDQSFTKKVDTLLLRGCAVVNVGHLESYSSIQRMSYSLVRSAEEFSPYRKDIEAFQKLCNVCSGCASLVKVFEGMLSHNDPALELRQMAQDLLTANYIKVLYNDPAPVRSATQQAPSAKKSWKEKLPKLRKKSQQPVTTANESNPLIDADILHKLSLEEQAILSNGFVKHHMILSVLSTFFEMKLQPREHFLLQALSYISLFPNHTSEATFSFPETFILSLADTIAVSYPEDGITGSEMVAKLERLKLLRPYPQPVLSPPEEAAGEKLLCVPDVIQRIVTFELDDADRHLITSIANDTLQMSHKGTSLYLSALKKLVKVLN